MLFPARAPKAPSPAHAAPVTAPEMAPLKAPSANPSRNDPPFIAALFLQPLPYQSSGQCSQNAPASMTPNIPPVNAAAIPNR